MIATGLVITALLVVAYILGSELCLPAARRALKTGEDGVWITATSLVTLGEWAMITACATLLLIVQDTWHLFTATLPGRMLGLGGAALVVTAALLELTGRTRKNRATVLSRSLDLVLPSHGVQRELYRNLQHQLESGTRLEQERIVRHLLR